MIPLNKVLDICREDEGYREDYLTCLYEQAAKLPIRSTIVEIGCYRGLSTLTMAAAIKDKDSHIFTIDPIFTIGKFTYPDDLSGSMTLESSFPEVYALWDRLHLIPYISIIADYSSRVLAWWNSPIDLLLVDGEHSFQMVKVDCQWVHFVKKDRRAIFDDWVDPVERAVRSYVSEHPECQLVQYGKPPEHLCLSYIQK